MGITDILPDLPALRVWSTAYEHANMLPVPINCDVTSFMMGKLLHAVPKALGLKVAFLWLALCLLEERVHIAMMCVFFLFLPFFSLQHADSGGWAPKATRTAILGHSLKRHSNEI